MKPVADMKNIHQLDLAQIQAQTRRHFLGWGTGGLGAFS